LLLIAFLQINNSFCAFSGLLQSFRQSELIAEIINQRHTARVESNFSNYCSCSKKICHHFSFSSLS
jgi:hypothetical protein